MFKEKYHHMNEQIKPSSQLINNVIYERNNNKMKYIFHKPIAITALLMICIFTTIPVLSATVPAIYEIIYQISPSTAQFFKPIQKSCEDNGIKMQVEAAYIHDNVAEIYITMQDLIGERIDETTDLFDSYSINRPFSSAAGCTLVGYDAKTKTATFLITISEFDNKKITGKKLTFSVREFLSGKHHYDNTSIDVDLSLLDNNINTQLVKITGGGGINYEKYMPDFKTMDYDYKVKVLSSINSIDFPVDYIEITAIGYIDGMLHVQTATKNKETTDNHGFIYLKDKNGNNIQCDYNIGFRENITSENRIDYDEYIFDIPQSEIGQYSLYGDFVVSGLFTQGNWEVTFPIEEIKK
ncbi:DUF4179 domain-containing protein [Tissierella carlieri]|uniref:DUF4179 domain-containing protein n=1 Tax=Tissierella carlieri TaxID=689904 RepID=A0ABT1S7V7_9FIRM|nr:DUF4179 domain-containing protein [Tissierella carlieri]MCQ4922556.1 DUF4179 domain-containing protein [Tissierella carlieri]